MRNHYLAGAVLSLPLALAVSATAPAQAATGATITVGANCTLVNAINSANANADTGGCVAVGTYGADTIEIPAGNSIAFSAPAVENQPNALPAISSTITINGNGNTLSRAANAPDLRFFLLQNANANLTINRLTLSGGRAFAGGPNGGAIDCSVGQLTVNHSSFVNNFAANNGGAIRHQCNTLTVNNSTFSGNTTPTDTNGRGGAIGSFTGTLTVNNSTFVGNAASSGGAIAVASNNQQITLNNLTITGNTVSKTGDGILCQGGGVINEGSSTITLRNSIISGNRACTGGGNEIARTAGTITANGHNLIGDNGETFAEAISGTVGTGGTDFVATSDTGGGAVQTGNNAGTALNAIFNTVTNGVPQLSFTGGLTDTVALKRLSPAIDNANNDPQSAGVALARDQRGAARVNGTTGAADGSRPDIGAYEFIPQSGKDAAGNDVNVVSSNPVTNFTSQATTGFTAPAGSAFTTTGLFGFNVTNLANNGDTAIVTLTLPAGTNATGYVKCDGVAKTCSPMADFPALTTADLKDPSKPQGYVLNGDTVTLKLKDGLAPGDSDAVAQQITDPGAPVVGGGAAAGGGGGGAMGLPVLFTLGGIGLLAFALRRRQHLG